MHLFTIEELQITIYRFGFVGGFLLATFSSKDSCNYYYVDGSHHLASITVVTPVVIVGVGFVIVIGYLMLLEHCTFVSSSLVIACGGRAAFRICTALATFRYAASKL